MIDIGKLTRVPLLEVWKHEAHDFTQWMEDNIDVLNNVLEFELVNVDREQAAGSFSVDLVAKDENGGTIIIENQLEKSNHDHLGKVLTYLTAMSARAAGPSRTRCRAASRKRRSSCGPRRRRTSRRTPASHTAGTRRRSWSARRA